MSIRIFKHSNMIPTLGASTRTLSVVIPVVPPKGVTGMLCPGWTGASTSGNVGTSWSAVWFPAPYSLHLARFNLSQITSRARWISSSLTSKSGALTSRWGKTRFFKKKPICVFLFQKDVFSCFCEVKKISLAASPPSEWKKGNMGVYGPRHGVAASMKESSDTTNIPQKYETHSNPGHVLAFEKN